MKNIISFREYIYEAASKVSMSQLKELEKTLDALFSAIDIDIEFTKHFFDRINDPRNDSQIRVGEVRDLFRAEFKKYKNEFKNMKPDFEALLKDLQTDINIPFVISWDEKNKELDLVLKTILRKKGFKTSNKIFKV